MTSGPTPSRVIPPLMPGSTVVQSLWVVACLGTLGLNLLAYRHARSMLVFAAAGEKTAKPEALSFWQKLRVLINGVAVPRTRCTLAPHELSPRCESLLIPVGTRVKLGAWHVPVESRKVLIILFHGYSSQKTAMIPEGKALLDLGYPVLLVDFRGAGDSSENYTSIGLLEGEDVVAATRYARETLGYSQIILYGQSMGAAAVLSAVGRLGLNPDLIIAEAVFDRLFTTVKHRFRAMGIPAFPFAQLLMLWGGWILGFNGFRHNPVEYAAKVSCPILFLHGALDPRVRVEEARRVFGAVPGQKWMHEFPSLGHKASVEVVPDQWRLVVTPFLARFAKV